MTYPFVPAHAQFGPRKAPVKAFVVHMAEGGGTVGFLSRPNPRNVSVHYVIETTGRIVQMVKEADATGSINPNDLRTSDDPLLFGATIRKAVMGAWDRDPNSAVITVEIEGFASAGPNTAQHGSLRTLVNDVRSRHPAMGMLGHRDFQDYKPCPGKLIHWAELGGHGLPAQGEPDVTQAITVSEPLPGEVTLTVGDGLYDAPDGTLLRKVSAAETVAALFRSGTWIAIAIPSTTTPPTRLVYVKRAEVEVVRASGDCRDQVAAEHERVRSAAIAALEAIA